MTNTTRAGTLEVVCGSMFSGKTEELIRRLRRAQYAKKNVMAFKHSWDNRQSVEYLCSHDGSKLSVTAVEDPLAIPALIAPEVEVVGIDEVQFFTPVVVDIIMDLVARNISVIVAGLDMDFRGQPFGCIAPLLAIAEKVTKLRAICMHCGAEAHFSQRLINGKPARYDDPVIMIGAQECYEARCRACFVIDRRPIFQAQIKPIKQKSQTI